MKKIIAILAAASMLAVTLSFVGCTNENADDKNNDDTNVDTQKDADEENKEDNNNDADTEDTDKEGEASLTVVEGKLTMATNAFFPPYEYYDGEDIVGIDAEIAAAVAEKLGLELVIEDMEFNSIINSVMSGAADIGLAGMTVTDERLESVDFTTSYANGVQVVIVTEDSEIAAIDDLSADGAEYKIGVQLATTGDTYSTDDFGEGRVVRYSNGNEAVLGLLGGDVQCVIIDNEPAKALVAANEGLKILETAYADEDYAACVAKGNDALLDKLNVAIDELTSEGVIDEIVDKYIK